MAIYRKNGKVIGSSIDDSASIPEEADEVDFGSLERLDEPAVKRLISQWREEAKPITKKLEEGC